VITHPHNRRTGGCLSLSDAIFVATRQDGLGGRLRAMTNAKFLASQAGCRFGFVWRKKGVAEPDFHHIDTAAAIFDSTFLEKYYLGKRLNPTGYVALGEEQFTLASLRANAEEKKLNGWICEKLNIVDKLQAGSSVKSDGLARAFCEIGFAEPIREVFEHARSVHLPNRNAALHLRSGDIVRGRYRIRLRPAQKVISSLLAKAIIRRLQEQGREVILIGEDQNTLEYIKSETGCRLIDDFNPPPQSEPMQRVFFEMAMMSRCADIYAGSSSMFAKMASMIGRVPLHSPTDLFDHAEQADALRRELHECGADYHPLEAAYGYLSAYLATQESGENDGETLLENAYAIDPANDFYPVKLASFRFGKTQYRQGEAILARHFTTGKNAEVKDANQSLEWMTRMEPDGWFDWEDDLPLFLAAAEAGMPFSAAFVSVALAGLGDVNQANEFADRALASQPQNKLFRRVKGRVRRKARNGWTLPDALGDTADKLKRLLGRTRP